jgi:hypothetical protein
LLSGRASNPGPLVQPRVPAVLTAWNASDGAVGNALRGAAAGQPVFPAPAAKSTLRRLTLARWIASEDNPLTARVIVNRVWQHHFGEGTPVGR